ncbi:putative mucin TcMUCII [Trypanosoma cruzi]|uniref:Mucin TcMUCII, putative n=2 Tax=Trypanosoma cruzi TaxID=5693 RepID=Q4DSN4_TRYCC|nr:mucin TcMUCII, putative [Trypanosoma cruzi]EAN95542.1 mucin TcMUCII, putative [Trypanosoma cruzi]PWU90934.1 putative mucin TcMUCII [Trypanosoma cruzi]RNC39867.1 mucin TcMUCII [Trypanosoma cruzi]|eukprot:XP_817393.1 mucin TcMUCII [Trypanosoma cruzi strain CL Brener]
MMTWRLLCALLVLALCCCPSVCVTATSGDQVGDSPNSTAAQQPGADDSEATKTSTAPNSTGPTVTLPKLEDPDSQQPAPAGSPNTEGPESIPKEGAGPGTDGSGSPGGSVSPAAASSISVTGTVPAQSQKENAPTTTTTTTTKAPTTTTTTTTEAPSTTTTRAPSLLRESDGSLSSSAWVCAPLLLAVSALAYTTVG